MTAPACTALCNICGGREHRFLWKGKDRFYHLEGSFNLFRCEGCGLIFVHPFLSDEALAKYYPQNYYSYEAAAPAGSGAARNGSKTAYYLRHPFKAANAIVYSKLLKQNARVSLPAGSEVLEIGCGDGAFLIGMRQQGCRVWGVDISEAALGRLKKAAPDTTAYCGNVWNAGFPAKHFDLIHLSHVVEHVPDIRSLAAELVRILKPGGQVSVQVPNSASLTPKLFGPIWIHQDTPRHVYVFSRKNLARFFQDKGLHVLKSRTLENSFSILGSFVYLWNEMTGAKLRIDRTQKFWDSEILKLLLAPYCVLVNAFGIGDTMEFILTRQEA